jgi:hypothetical protein
MMIFVSEAVGLIDFGGLHLEHFLRQLATRKLWREPLNARMVGNNPGKESDEARDEMDS